MEKAPSWKNKHFEILCRIDDICRQCDIRMFLCDATALAVYRDGKLSDYVSIAIETKDAYKFIRAIEDNTDLGVRGMFNHYRYPRFDIKVYDSSTIDFDLKNYNDMGFCGLYVNVRFVKYISKINIIAKNWRRAENAYSQYINVEYDKIQIGKRNRIKLYNAVCAITSEETLGRRVFDMLVNRYSCSSATVELGNKIFPQEVFKELQMTNLCGHDFLLPKNPEEYLELRYGENWREVKLNEWEDTDYQFRDGDFSWEDYKKYVGYIDLDEYEKSIETLRRSGLEYRRRQRLFKRKNEIIKRSHVRFLLWQKYMPMKEEIIRLYEKRDMEKLLEIYDIYIRYLKYFNKRRMTIFFDRELFDIAKELLEYIGRPELAAAIERIIPEEHLEPIRIKNYKGEYI